MDLRNLFSMRVAALLFAVLVAPPSLLRAQCTSLECQILVAAGGQLLDAYGRDVSVSGDLAVVSADAEDDRGAAYAYQRLAGQWVFPAEDRARRHRDRGPFRDQRQDPGSAHGDQ